MATVVGGMEQPETNDEFIARTKSNDGFDTMESVETVAGKLRLNSLEVAGDWHLRLPSLSAINMGKSKLHYCSWLLLVTFVNWLMFLIFIDSISS